MSDSPLIQTLRHFAAAEANLVKAEAVLAEIVAAIPSGICFGEDLEYEKNCRDFDALLAALPKIDGWRPPIALMGLDEIAQNRLDARELDEPACTIMVERRIDEPPRLLREYRHRFNVKHRALIREAVGKLVGAVDENFRTLAVAGDSARSASTSVASGDTHDLKKNAAEIALLLAHCAVNPPRWSEFYSSLQNDTSDDLATVVEQDWLTARAGLREFMYAANEPVPVDVDDLGTLVGSKPLGPVATKLKWERVDEGEFERLVFALISSELGYENPEWLMKTNAPDRGRDLSVWRVYADSLGGTVRQRVIIQCKHWQSKSVGVADIGTLRTQMRLWEPPRVDSVVIATSGRFTSDAVSSVEKHNQSDTSLRIEMWPESHLERLLATRPAIIAEFRLR